MIAAGVIAIVAAFGTADGSVELLGTDLSALGMFLIGLCAGVLVLWGWGFTKIGTKRSLRQRRESRRLNELSEKLERHDAERREEDTGREDRSF